MAWRTATRRGKNHEQTRSISNPSAWRTMSAKSATTKQKTEILLDVCVWQRHICQNFTSCWKTRKISLVSLKIYPIGNASENKIFEYDFYGSTLKTRESACNDIFNYCKRFIYRCKKKTSIIRHPLKSREIQSPYISLQRPLLPSV